MNSKKVLQKKKIKNSGQAMIEYVLLLSISVAIAIAFNSTLKKIINEGILTFNAVLERDLRTGEFATARNGKTKDIWVN